MTRSTRHLVLILAAAALAPVLARPTPVQAAPRETWGIESGADALLSRRVAMGVGKSIIVDLPADAAEIVVGNPKVANAVVRSTRKLYIMGVETGQTTIFALDRSGRQIANLEISIGRDVGELGAAAARRAARIRIFRRARSMIRSFSPARSTPPPRRSAPSTSPRASPRGRRSAQGTAARPTGSSSMR